jgi:hypothetical protein
MKMNLEENYTIAQGLAPVSVAAGTDAGATVDHANAPCAAFILNAGAFASGAAITMKVQYSEDDSTWSDDDGSSGNEYTVKLTAAGITTLDVPNPMGRYTRAFITVATDAVVNGVVNISGPVRRVSV